MAMMVPPAGRHVTRPAFFKTSGPYNIRKPYVLTRVWTRDPLAFQYTPLATAADDADADADADAAAEDDDADAGANADAAAENYGHGDDGGPPSVRRGAHLSDRTWRPEIPRARGSCNLVALRVSRRQDLSGIRLRAKYLFETAVQTRADPPAASPGRLALPAEAA